METMYRATAYWTGVEPPTWMSKIVFEGLMSVWNKYCELVNPVFQLLNDEYNGPMDGVDEDGDMRDATESQYMKYLQDGLQQELEKIQKQGKFPKNGMFIKRFVVDAHVQLAAVAYNDSQVTVSLQPM